MRRIGLVTCVAFFLVIYAGCSQSTSPGIPQDSDNLSQQIIANYNGESNREIASAYSVSINIANGIFEITPVNRLNQYHLNLRSIFPAVLKIDGFGNDPAHNDDFFVDITLVHPSPGNGIDGFDPRVTAVIPADHESNSFHFPIYNVLANHAVVMEPDGYTRMFDNLNIDGNANPFKAYFKNEPNRVWSSTNVTSDTQRWYLDLDGFQTFEFVLVCDVSTGYPDPPVPVDHNAQEPVQVDTMITGDIYENGGYSSIDVVIIDWQGPELVNVSIECPDLFDGLIYLDYQGPGVNPDEYTYHGEFGNLNGAIEGVHYLLVNAFDVNALTSTYDIVPIVVNSTLAPSYDDVYFDFSTTDIKEIHIPGIGFGNEIGLNTVYLDGETTGFTLSNWSFYDIAIQIPQDNLDHVVQVEIDGNMSPEIFASESESILLVYNSNNTDSVSIKDYYSSDVTGRNIKPDMICELNLSLNEAITRVQYNEQIKAPVETFIESNGLKNKIKYIVLTKGMPLKIAKTSGSSYNDLDYAALDSEMTLLFSNEYNLPGRIINPYYGKTSGTWFHPFKYQWGAARMSYLVTRLAAWELTEVYGMIDRALDPYSGPDAYALLDGGKSYDRMESAGSIYEAAGIQHLFENAEVFLTADTIADPSISDFVLGYTGHGIHHNPNPPGGGLYVFELGFTLLNGAIFNTYESSNCTTFNEANRSSHGNVGDWIRIGGTGGIGHVYEPWSDAVGDERYLYPRQIQGHNLAESCYIACRYVSWTETIVGDPLCIVDVQ